MWVFTLRNTDYIGTRWLPYTSFVDGSGYSGKGKLLNRTLKEHFGLPAMLINQLRLYRRHVVIDTAPVHSIETDVHR